MSGLLRTYTIITAQGTRNWQAEDGEHARAQHAEAFPDEPIPNIYTDVTVPAVDTTPMWLIYNDEGGTHHYQPWEDLDAAGTLIDPENGYEMALIGWTTTAPKGN